MSKSKIRTNEEVTLISILTLCGLTEKESKLYWILLNMGELTGSELVKKSNFKRGNTYALLNQLEKKSLIYKHQKKGKTYFIPESPQKIYELLERKNKEAKQAQLFFDNMLPVLSSRYKLAINKPIIRYYEGDLGIQQVFEDIYNKKTEPVYGCVNLEEVDKTFPEYIKKKLIPKRIKNNILAKSFISKSDKSIELQKHDNEEKRETILLDQDKYPLPAEIDVYENKIAMLTFKKREFVGILIENEDIAKSLKSIFKCLHELLHNPQQK